MAIVTSIDPVTRLEGHLEMEITVDEVGGIQQVVDARAAGTLFRGFETILVDRDPRDAPDITQRICGVCPVSHGMAAVLALDAAAGITVPDNARIMRNLVLGSNYLQNHLLHFYHLALQDFVDGPPMPPWQPSWAVDKRLTAAETRTLVSHYVAALDARRTAHEMAALFGGRMPHPPAYVAGGFTTTPRPARIAQFKSSLGALTAFIESTYLPDVALIARRYSDYHSLGRGCGNLLAFGGFGLDGAGDSTLMRRGRVTDGSATVQSVDVDAITEHVSCSWYDERTADLHPAAGATVPQYPKDGAYSWLKAPRYADRPYEAGPLARMWINGEYRRGISVMDRHEARALEALEVARALRVWVDQLHPGGPVYDERFAVPDSASSCGLTEAPRGALGHWITIAGGKLASYQVVTPTCWNVSPRDRKRTPGPLEHALIGTPVQDADRPVEVLRVIHSYDPCMACAVHVMRPAEGRKVFHLPHDHGEEEERSP